MRAVARQRLQFTHQRNRSDMSADDPSSIRRCQKPRCTTTPPSVSPPRRQRNGAFDPSALKAHEGLVRQLHSKIADIAAGVESVARDFCGEASRKKQTDLTRRFAKIVDKELAGIAGAVDKHEAECMTTRARSAAANQAIEEVFHAAKGLDLFIKDVRNL